MAIVATVLAGTVSGSTAARSSHSLPSWQVPAVPSDGPIVSLDVRVVDDHGQPVTDLSRDEFTITEDGSPQAIRTFSPRALTGGPSESGRQFLLVLGRGGLAPVSHSVAAAAAFVRHLLPRDTVGLIDWDRAIGLTTDHERVAAVLDRDAAGRETLVSRLGDWRFKTGGRYGPKGIPDAIQSDIDRLFQGPAVGQSTPSDLDAWTRQAVKPDVDLSKLYAGVEYLRGIDGEKDLIYLADEDMPLTIVEDDRTLGARASDARVSVHVARDTSSELAAVATLTGGTVNQYDYGRWDRTFPAIDRATRFEYAIDYQSTQPTTEASMRAIVVAVTRPHVIVSCRQLYFAPTLTALIPEEIVAYSRMLSADIRSSDFRMKAKVRDVRDDDARAIDVQLTIDAAGVSFKTVGQERLASLRVLVISSDYSRHETAWHTVQLTLPADDRPPSGDVTTTVRSPVLAQPGRVTVVAYDARADVVAVAYGR